MPTRFLAEKIFESTLGSSGAFDSGTFATDGTDLELFLQLRSTISGTAVDVVRMFFNGDTTVTNYRRQFLDAALSAAPTAGEGNVPNIGGAVANGATANYFSEIRAKILNYASGKTKSVEVMNTVYSTSGAAGEVTIFTFLWNSTAAISRIQIKLDGDPTDLFVTGSYMRLLKWADLTF